MLILWNDAAERKTSVRIRDSPFAGAALPLSRKFDSFDLTEC